MRLRATSAAIRVPATVGNVGPGFDAMGLALELRDELHLEATTGGVEITVEGEGAGAVPAGEDHLVVRALRRALDHAGAAQIGVRLHCRNRIPHGRGLGSSAAAVVAGIALAREIIADPDVLDDAAMLALAAEFEGHPDNAAPAIYGGMTLSYMRGGRWYSEPLEIAEDVLAPVVLVPSTALSTSKARALLPQEVPHDDAAFTAARAALLVHALRGRADLLLDATEERLHQEQRAPGMPASVELMRVLRAEGYPAVIAGAGPTVLVLRGGDQRMQHVVARVVDDPGAWRLARVAVAQRGAFPVVV